MTDTGLHQSYTRLWIATIPTALLAYLLGLPEWTYATPLAIAAGVEVIAAFIRRKTGDTLTEHIKVLLKDRPALIPLVLGFSVWLVWTALSILPPGRHLVEMVGWDVGLAALAAGVLGWLLCHLPVGGRFG